MLRIIVTVCAVSHLVTALPQQRPLAQQTPVARSAAAAPQAFGPAYTQTQSFGGPTQQTASAAQPQVRARGPTTYQSQQPILISQGNPSASPATQQAFASFPGAQFAGTGRQILTLRSPNQASADEDEYEYEDDDEPTIQTRPSPTPQRQVPVTRPPVRVSQQTPQTFASYNQGQRFPAQFQSQKSQQPQQQQQQPQQQQQQNRARQPVPQQQFPQTAQPVQGARLQGAQRPVQGQQQAQFGIDGRRNRLTTPPPVQTVNRYMKQNEDGSMTWGYENEDGTFKEETLGSDCVVRGKYGYIDPDGNKREYEYQTGNPCDPNKKDQEEEALEEDDDLPDGPSRPQQIAGILNARPRPVQRRPIPGGQLPQFQPQPQYQK